MAGNEHNRPKHALHYFCKAMESDHRGSHTQRISRPLDKRRWTIDTVHVMKYEINYNLNKCFNDNPSKFGTAWNRLKQVPAVALKSFEMWTWKFRIIFFSEIGKWTDSLRTRTTAWGKRFKCKWIFKQSNKFLFLFKNAAKVHRVGKFVWICINCSKFLTIAWSLCKFVGTRIN